MAAYQNIDFDIIWKKIHNQASPEDESLLNKWVEDCLFQSYNTTGSKETKANEAQIVENMQSIVSGRSKALLILADGSKHDMLPGKTDDLFFRIGCWAIL